MDVWRCDVTGNPVGTDTRMVGAAPCNCQGCRAEAEEREDVAELIRQGFALNIGSDEIADKILERVRSGHR